MSDYQTNNERYGIYQGPMYLAAQTQYHSLMRSNMNPRQYMDSEHYWAAVGQIKARLRRLFDLALIKFPKQRQKVSWFCREWTFSQDAMRERLIDKIWERKAGDLYWLLASRHGISHMNGYINDFINGYEQAHLGNYWEPDIMPYDFDLDTDVQ